MLEQLLACSSDFCAMSTSGCPTVFAFCGTFLGQFLQLGDRLVVGVLALLDDASTPLQRLSTR